MNLMDFFKEKQYHDIGPGGLKCPCCNKARGKQKNSHLGKTNLLNKKARKKLKIDLEKEIFKELFE
jgi:hypothetical protein